MRASAPRLDGAEWQTHQTGAAEAVARNVSTLAICSRARRHVTAQDPAQAAQSFGERSGRLIVIGNFDGVHRGHQHLIRQVLDDARRAGLQPAILTFDPHPAMVLGRGAQPTLTRLERKIELLRELDPQLEVLIEAFTARTAQMSPEQFAQTVLRERWGARQVVVGVNFRFGHRRQGDLRQLAELGQRLGFTARALPLLYEGREPISSSRIRALLRAGDVQECGLLLGRPHTVQGTVVHGAHLGRRLGFPTANLEQVVEMLPRRGVYSCRVWMLSGSCEVALEGAPAICNVGIRPTVRGTPSDAYGPNGVDEDRLEVHLLQHSVPLYDAHLRVTLEQRIRDERRFSGLEELQTQIRADVAVAERQLAVSRG